MHVLIWAADREHAKRLATPKLRGGQFGGPDNWDVIPLTNKGDRVYLDIILSA